MNFFSKFLKLHNLESQFCELLRPQAPPVQKIEWNPLNLVTFKTKLIIQIEVLKCLEITALQSCTGPVQGQNRVFPVKFSTQGKTCFHYREPLFSLQGPLFSLQGFPCEKTSQGKPCFHYREWVCSVQRSYFHPIMLNLPTYLKFGRH